MARNKSKVKTKPFHFQLDQKLRKPLEEMSVDNKRSMTDEINLAIEERIKNHKKEMSRKLEEEAA